MDKLIAKREYGTTYEMSKETRILKYEFKFTLKQYEKIIAGIIPMEMGDRWFIFYENSTLYCHWWSGECIYMLSFESHDNSFKTSKIQIVNDITIKPIKKDSEEINELTSLLKYSLLDGESFVETITL